MLTIHDPFLYIFFLSLVNIATFKVFFVNFIGELKHSFERGCSKIVEFDCQYLFLSKISKAFDMGQYMQRSHLNQLIWLLYKLIDKKMDVVHFEIFADIGPPTVLSQ